MKLIIAGSRTIQVAPFEMQAILAHYGLNPSEIISGTANGVDKCGEKYAKEADQVSVDWRSRKGFAKDQSKHRTWCKCRRYLKQRGNREHRRWVSKMIHHERWDEIYWHQDMFVSSWDAC